MNNKLSDFIKSPLARRQLIYILCISAVITLITSAAQIYLEFERDINNINKQFEHIENTNLKSLETSLWQIDSKNITSQLESILSLKNIVSLKITDSYTIFSVGEIKPEEKVITKKFPLKHDYAGTEIEIGTLHVSASLSEVYSDLFKRIFVILITQSVYIFTLSFFILMIIYNLVIKNLITISNYSKNISLNDLDTELVLDKSFPENDELRDLADSINDMRKRIKNDIIEKNKSEEKLRENEESLRITLNSIIDGVITTDLDGYVISMNPVSEKITGWSYSTASGEKIDKIFQIYDLKKRTKLKNPFYTAIDHGKISDFSSNTVLISNTGREIIISYSATTLKDDNENIKGVVLVFRDITAQFEKDMELIEKEKIYRLIFEQSGASIIITEPDSFNFIDFNSKTSHMLGYTRQELKEKTFTDLIQNKNAENQLKTYAHDEKITDKISFEADLLTSHNEVITCILTAGRIDLDGRKRILAILNDFTEIKKIQEKLIESQKMDSIGNLAGGIAHDFNNMLSGILGYSEILDAEETDPEKKSLIKGITKSAEKASVLTNKLLGFGKRGKNLIKAVNLNESVNEVISILERSIGPEKNITFETEFQNDLFQIDADPGQINQVLMNLCLNSAEAVDLNGKIIIETHNFLKDQQQFAGVIIKDNGYGIDSRIQSRIFEPFFSTKKEKDVNGSGLGLATVYGIVKNHNGNIEFQSEKNNGTIFKISFPKGEKSLNQNHNNNENKTEDNYVLIVEDEKILNEMLETILTQYGYKVLTASNGKEGVEIFKENYSYISAVILDLKMPEMNGKEAFLEMKKTDKNLRVLVSTGYGSNEEAQELIDMGAMGLLSKPFHMKELKEKIEEIFE
ncbi:MAG: PAS domain S-box protein [Thermodesulfobacteriota bacterium]